jgi:hypothetical protein
MPLPREGEGFLKKILALMVFAALVYAGVKTVPVYRSSFQLSDYIRERALRASADPPPATRLQAEIVNYGERIGLPLTPETVQVATHPGTVSIKLDYTVPVNLGVFTWNLRFTPSVESRAY